MENEQKARAVVKSNKDGDVVKQSLERKVD